MCRLPIECRRRSDKKQWRLQRLEVRKWHPSSCCRYGEVWPFGFGMGYLKSIEFKFSLKTWRRKCRSRTWNDLWSEGRFRLAKGAARRRLFPVKILNGVTTDVTHLNDVIRITHLRVCKHWNNIRNSCTIENNKYLDAGIYFFSEVRNICFIEKNKIS